MPFGHNHFEQPASAASREVARPTGTDSETLDLLKAEVLKALEADPGLYDVLTAADIELITNALAVRQEKAGAAFTPDMLSNPHELEGFDGEVRVAARERLSGMGVPVPEEPTVN